MIRQLLAYCHMAGRIYGALSVIWALEAKNVLFTNY